MQTGENEQALRKILDMTRLIAITLLTIHFYFYCYQAFRAWHLNAPFTDQLLVNISRTGLLNGFQSSKCWPLGMLVISLIGARGRLDENINFKGAVYYIITGLTLYFGSWLVLSFRLEVELKTAIYIGICSTGFLLIITGGTMLSRIIKNNLNNNDIFNNENETFPQEERLLDNEFSVNLPARYQLKGKYRSSWINFINPARGLLVAGSPGSGKSFFVIRHIITQALAKQHTMLVYDFKFPDLSVITYNHWLKNRHKYVVPPKFYAINFDDLTRSNRCNPLDPDTMMDITDATESARTILLGLNREWIKKQGDFFVESPINLVTAVIWYLRKYRSGQYCTLPHVIEFLQLDYNSLFTLLRQENEVEVLINPFVNAYLNDVMEQLEGQIASAKIALARLSSPQLYYVLSGNDFKLDINNPDNPKILCIGNNPQKIQIYGAVLSLFVNRLVKLVNQKGKLKSSLIFDEFPTVYLSGIDSLIATARSNKVATTLAVQDLSQLRKDYGREQADVIMGIVGNIISGQVTGDTAKQLSDRIGRIMQERQSLSVNSADTSISKSRQLESAVPASKIASLSSGEFVGMVADNPDTKIELKAFHCEVINDIPALHAEENAYKPIPVIRKITPDMVQRNYIQVRKDVQQIVESEMERLMADPALVHLIIRK
ncbi:Type IV secretory pathway, VirD4 component, TraG/TraD family ATPase [Mucilaginibacter pineti]|uniref:Type IV secretory pathway, VirD4 component, TraG/TraD family ATPase n=1 Tax=Mucilaginibacter pineti TaxID=1391627 RepID=A0A1G7ING3_9SPHI|nr:conjugal transfer protein MobC [Mucilaginibacter pineti]SDF14280.1 Type IV secretory pathway, VirD4 component, TraG/TraD family ATPase [Mucilaginibacter pineti]